MYGLLVGQIVIDAPRYLVNRFHILFFDNLLGFTVIGAVIGDVEFAVMGDGYGR